ncbi:MAG: carboxypeptidase M32, partial [Candidatus Zixiibacteriota bacterium]
MPQKPEQALKELTQIIIEASLLGSTGALLGWDERTYMPHGGSAHRANQLALLAGMVHDKATSPRVGELIGAVEGSA